VAWTARRIADRVATAHESLVHARDSMTALPSADAGLAAAIMEELRDAYLNIELPDVPAVADPPVPGTDGAPVFAAGQTTTPALLSRVWQDGLVAAAGAPLPGLLPGYGPGFGGPGQFVGPGPGTGTLPPTDVAGTGSLGRFADGSASGGGFDRAGLGEEPARAVGHSSLAPRIDPVAGMSTVAGLAGAGMAGVAGGAPPFMGGFMPPMGMGAGSEFGRLDGRGAPAWLVETLTIFDAAVEVVPDVVG
jgi:hypothetical protein